MGLAGPELTVGDEPFVRDVAVMAVIFGVGSFAWFGWGQEDIGALLVVLRTGHVGPG